MKQTIVPKAVAMLVLLATLLVACGTTPETKTGTQPTSTAQKTPTTVANTCSPTSGDTYAIVSEQSEASYSVKEQFLRQNLPVTAVGKTKDVTGDFALTKSDYKITTMNISVDLRTLKSDEERRDNAIRERWLESDKYPFAKFAAKDVETVSGSYTDGTTVSFDVTGDMTIHDTTRKETFKVTGKREGSTISGTATTKILLKNYNVEPPNIANFLTVEDGVTLEVKFVAEKGKCA